MCIRDSIYAVSAGACHACSYIAGQKGRALRVAVNYLDDPRYCGMRSFLKTGDFFGVKFCYDTIPNRLDPMDYAAALRYPGHFYAVVTNCRTGKAEYIESRDMKKNISAIRASASLPLLSRMVPIDGQNYLDGGVADSIPLSKSMADGNEKHVLILTQMASYRKQPNRMMPAIRARYRRWPKLVQALGDRHIRYNLSLIHICFGGDEFLVYLSHTDSESIARHKAELFCQLFARRTSQLYGKLGPTLSIGVVCSSEKMPFETWYARVDRAMYTAKRSGKSRVHVDVIK